MGKVGAVRQGSRNDFDNGCKVIRAEEVASFCFWRVLCAPCALENAKYFGGRNNRWIWERVPDKDLRPPIG